MADKFVGHLTAIENKNDDENVNEDVLLEVVDFTEAAEVEIAFNDRNERCYLKFSLADLVAHVGVQAGSKESA
jgi:hypothetical protein